MNKVRNDQMDEHEKGYQIKITLPGEVKETDVKLSVCFFVQQISEWLFRFRVH